MPGQSPNSDALDLEGNDSISAQQVFLAATNRDLEGLRSLLMTVPATVQDPYTGLTPLHAAVASCAPRNPQSNGESNTTGDCVSGKDMEQQEKVKDAEQVLKILFQNGAIWNDLDSSNETPGCLAYRLGLRDLYQVIVDAGVRSELLFNRLDDFATLATSEGEEQEEEEDEGGEEASVVDVENHSTMQIYNLSTKSPSTSIQSFPPDGDSNLQNEIYLSSVLSFTGDRILDSAANGVMMSWESSLMRRTASLLLSGPQMRVLNIGFGMGIFDSFIQEEHHPCEHHIVEAHPDVLRRIREAGWDSSAEGFTKKNVTIHPGRWQDVLPQLVEKNLEFDAIFFDTFAEDYRAFRNFFDEYVISLLTPDGRWSFFHGLGADRQVCYDVYTKVVEMDLFDAGFVTEWEVVELPELHHNESQEKELWQGVKREYFSVASYLLPICKFVA